MKCYIIRKSNPIKARISVENGVLRIVFLEGENERVREVNLESLKQRPDFGDHALFLIYDQSYHRAANVNPETFNNVSNLYAATIATKMDAGAYHRSVMQIFPTAAVYVPFADSPISEWAIGISCGPEDNDSNKIEFGSNITAEEGVSFPLTGELNVFPKVKFLSQTASTNENSDVEISFRLESADGSPIVDVDAEIYLDVTAGYLTKKRVKTLNGAGTTTFRPDGLARGESAKIKCGFKYYSGTDDVTVSIK